MSSQEQEENVNFQLTGKNIPINKIELIKHIHRILFEFQYQKQNNIKPKVDPFNENIYISNGENVVMVPHDIQNEGIKIYMDNPSIYQEYLKIYTNANVNPNSNENNSNKEIENKENENEIEKKEPEEKEESLFGIISCIIFFYLVTQCAPRFWECEDDE